MDTAGLSSCDREWNFLGDKLQQLGPLNGGCAAWTWTHPFPLAVLRSCSYPGGGEGTHPWRQCREWECQPLHLAALQWAGVCSVLVLFVTVPFS